MARTLIWRAAPRSGRTRSARPHQAQSSHALLSNLAPRTAYYFKAIATNANGTASSTIASFVTAGAGPVPQVTRTWDWNVAATMAGLSMQIDNANLISSAYFQYGTDPNLANAAQTATESIPGVQGSVASNVSLTGLTSGTTYYYRAVVTNANGAGQSGIQSFTTAAATPPSPPSIDSVWSWQVTDTTAGLSMSVSNLPVATSVNFTYGTDPNLASGTTVGQNTVGPAASGSESHALLSNLAPRTAYYFKAIATNANGTASSTIASFVTAGAGPVPQVTRTWDWNVAATTAGLSMQIDNANLISSAYFQYGTDPNLANAAQTATESIPGVQGSVASNVSLTGLTSGTTYYYRAVVTNANGAGQSGIQSFTTP